MWLRAAAVVSGPTPTGQRRDTSTGARVRRVAARLTAARRRRAAAHGGAGAWRLVLADSWSTGGATRAVVGPSVPARPPQQPAAAVVVSATRCRPLRRPVERQTEPPTQNFPPAFGGKHARMHGHRQSLTMFPLLSVEAARKRMAWAERNSAKNVRTVFAEATLVERQVAGLIGDSSAQVGCVTDGWEEVMERWWHGTLTGSGERLVDICAEIDLKVCGTVASSATRSYTSGLGAFDLGRQVSRRLASARCFDRWTVNRPPVNCPPRSEAPLFLATPVKRPQMKCHMRGGGRLTWIRFDRCTQLRGNIGPWSHNYIRGTP